MMGGPVVLGQTKTEFCLLVATDVKRPVAMKWLVVMFVRFYLLHSGVFKFK